MGRTKARSMAEREVLLEGLDDYVGFWELFNAARDESDTDHAGEVRRRTLTLALGLIEEGLASPGFPTVDDRFNAVEASAEGTLARISREWDELGREPDVGDIIWFSLTDEGREVAKEIEASEG